MERLAKSLILLIAWQTVWSQDHGQDKKVSTPAAVVVSIPQYEIQVPKEDEKTVRLVSPAWGGLPQCASDGTMFVNYVLPGFQFLHQSLNSFNPDGHSQAFDTSRITDLYDTSSGALTFGAGEDAVVMLLRATKDPTTSSEAPQGAAAGQTGPDRVYTGEHGWFIAIFDRSGNYKKSFQVSTLGFEPLRMGVFDSGDILVLGVDPINRVPKLALFDPSGDVKRFLTPPEDLPTESAFITSSNVTAPENKFSKDNIQSMKLRQSLGFYQITQVKDSLLLVEPGSTGPIFEARPNGAVRAVPIKTPEGFVLDSVVPSDSGLFVRLRRKGTFSGKDADAIMYQINPTDGTPIKQIHMGNMSVWSVACVHDDKFQTIYAGSDGKMVLNRGKLEPAAVQAQIQR